MNGGEPFSEGNDGREHLCPGAGSDTPLPEARTIDMLHRNPDPPFVQPHFVEGHDVGVGDLREGFRLAEQARMLPRPVSTSLLTQQDLDRNAALELVVIGGIDTAVPTFSKCPEDEESPHEGARTKTWQVRLPLSVLWSHVVSPSRGEPSSPK